MNKTAGEGPRAFPGGPSPPARKYASPCQGDSEREAAGGAQYETSGRTVCCDGGTEPADGTGDGPTLADALAPYAEHRDAIEAELLGRDDDVGAMSRVALALLDGERPAGNDLDALGFRDPRDDDDGFQHALTAHHRRLTPAVLAEWADDVLAALDDVRTDPGE